MFRMYLRCRILSICYMELDLSEVGGFWGVSMGVIWEIEIGRFYIRILKLKW